VAALAISIMSLAGLPNAALAGSGPAVVAPSTAFTQMGQLSNAGIPLTVTWPVGTPDGAPLAHYELQKSIDGGTWTQIPLSKPLIRSVTVRVNAWSLFVFRLRAVDTAGVPGDWADASPRWLSFSQESEPEVGLTGGWQVVKDKAALGHRRAVTWTADESATFSFVGRQVAWLGRLGPNRGTASVSSSLGTTNVNLARSNASSQRIVFRATWPANGAHAVSITSTSPTKAVDVDAFLVLSDPPEGQLVGAGDISTCTNDNDTATAGVVASVLDANPLALAYTTGDNVYSKGTAAQFANCYDPTWGAFKARTRPTPGNHDYDDPGAAGYYAYFGENAGPAGKGWYRFEAGTWRVYAMNSECAVGSTCANSQLNWLKADLSANPHKCVLAIWHRPRFSTGLHGNSMRMAQAFSELYNFGADVVVGGHDHGYQRFMPATPSGVSDPTNGLRTFVAGMGGASLYRWKTTSPLLETRDNTTHGALRLDLHPGGYSWAFMPVAGATSYSDSGTAACH
jgi:hypothetical protein